MQNRGTASCRIIWLDTGPQVDVPLVGRSDDDLIADVAGADVVGIDSPFGWPEPFIEAVQAHRQHKPWPGRGQGLEPFRETLRLRCTDLVVKREVGLTPLSVAADKIAITTFRCALLLDRFENELGWPVDRSGVTGPAVEVYPAAALRQWRLTTATSYKAADAFEQRREITRGLARALGIDAFAPAVEDACRQTDHALDALISSVTARAAALGLTRRPESRDERDRAHLEGWIHFPCTDTAPDVTRPGSGKAHSE